MITVPQLQVTKWQDYCARIHEPECSEMHTAKGSVCTIYLVALYYEKPKNLHSCCVNDLIYVYCVLRAYFVQICMCSYIY